MSDELSHDQLDISDPQSLTFEIDGFDDDSVRGGGNLKTEGSKFRRAQFIDVQLPNGTKLSANRPRRYPGVIDLATLDSRVFVKETRPWIGVDEDGQEEIGLEVIDAVVTVLYNFNIDVLQKFMCPDIEESFKFSNISKERGIAIVRDGKEYLSIFIKDQSYRNIDLHAQYRRLVSGRWTPHSLRVDSAGDFGFDPIYVDSLRIFEKDVVVADWNFRILRELLILRPWLASDGAQQDWGLGDEDFFDSKIQQLEDESRQSDNDDDGPDAQVVLQDLNLDENNLIDPRKPSSYPLNNRSDSIPAGGLRLKLRSAECGSDLKDEEILRLKKENANLHSKFYELDAHIRDIMKGLSVNES